MGILGCNNNFSRRKPQNLQSNLISEFCGGQSKVIFSRIQPWCQQTWCHILVDRWADRLLPVSKGFHLNFGSYSLGEYYCVNEREKGLVFHFISIFRWRWHRRHSAVQDGEGRDCVRHRISQQARDYQRGRSHTSHRLSHQGLRGGSPQAQS